MSASFTKAYQIFMLILQVLNAINPEGLPPKWQAGFTGLLSALMAIQGVLAHYCTPAGNKIDGTTGAVKSSDGRETVATVPPTKL